MLNAPFLWWDDRRAGFLPRPGWLSALATGTAGQGSGNDSIKGFVVYYTSLLGTMAISETYAVKEHRLLFPDRAMSRTRKGRICSAREVERVVESPASKTWGRCSPDYNDNTIKRKTKEQKAGAQLHNQGQTGLGRANRVRLAETSVYFFLGQLLLCCYFRVVSLFVFAHRDNVGCLAAARILFKELKKPANPVLLSGASKQTGVEPPSRSDRRSRFALLERQRVLHGATARTRFRTSRGRSCGLRCYLAKSRWKREA